MNKGWRSYSDISIKWLLGGAFFLTVVLMGTAIGLGQIKMLAYMILAVGLLAIVSISRRLKLWLLALCIPLSLLRIPNLPVSHGFQICEFILVALSMDELLLLSRWNSTPLRLGIIIPLGLFTIAGFLCLLVGKSFITDWVYFCLMPLLWFFLASRKIQDREEVWLFVKLSLLTIVIFLAIVVWANMSGHFENVNPGSTTYQWRFGYGLIVALGPIRLNVWSTYIGTLVALGFPAGILLWLEDKNKTWWRMGAPLLLVGFAFVLILSATRGATVSVILGTFFVILASGRYRSRRLWIIVALLLVVFTLLGRTILNLFPQNNILRLLSLLQGVQGDENYQIRKYAVELTWKLILQHPMGVGFAYIFTTYGIDNAIVYSYLLEATGILGGIAFLMIVGQLTYTYGKAILNSPVGSTRDFATIGLGTLVVSLIAGVSSQSIMFQPVHSFVFWALLASTYHGLSLPVLPERESRRIQDSSFTGRA